MTHQDNIHLTAALSALDLRNERKRTHIEEFDVETKKNVDKAKNKQFSQSNSTRSIK